MKIEPPIKISWDNRTRDKVHTNTEHIEDLRPVFERQKTNIVFKDLEEVEKFIKWTETKAKYGQRTEIYTPQMKDSIKRVRSELREILQNRYTEEELRDKLQEK